jgi:hydroxypyruvate reductase
VSGPLSPDPTTFAAALDVLRRRGVLERAPPSVRDLLERGIRGEVPETPKPGDPAFERVAVEVIAGNAASVAAARDFAVRTGWTPAPDPGPIHGEAREAARLLLETARDLPGPGRIALVSGGETTVTVRGTGTGGRNQELALAFALAEEESPLPARAWTLLSAGTDGIDGPTDAAGAVVDRGTLDRARRIGVDPERALAENDSHRALAASGDLVRTGPTGTNVADIQVLLVWLAS